MGLISRVSSRTYRLITKKVKININKKMFAKSLAHRLARNPTAKRTVTNFYAADFNTANFVLKGANLEGRFKVWLGFLRTPPAAQTGYDCTFSFTLFALGTTVSFLALNMIIFPWFGKHYVADCLRVNLRPQMPIAKCQTTEERQAYMEHFMNTYWIPKYYKDDDEEEEDDE